MQFSSRKEGNCAAIAAQIGNYYAEEQVLSYVVDEKTVQPCNHCNYECLKVEQICQNLSPAQKEIIDAICNADLVYFIVPNYCGFPCANYFAFNERSVGYFNLDRALMQKYMDIPKRFILISNSEDEIFVSAMQQQVDGAPDILYLKSSKYGKKSINGDIMDSEAAKADLNAFLSRYCF